MSSRRWVLPALLVTAMAVSPAQALAHGGHGDHGGHGGHDKRERVVGYYASIASDPP